MAVIYSSFFFFRLSVCSLNSLYKLVGWLLHSIFYLILFYLLSSSYDLILAVLLRIQTTFLSRSYSIFLFFFGLTILTSTAWYTICLTVICASFILCDNFLLAVIPISNHINSQSTISLLLSYLLYPQHIILLSWY